MHWYQWDGDALLLRLRVQPRARADVLDEPVGDALRVRLRAPPVDGKANAALVAFLAETFGVPRKQVVLVSGAHARTKSLRIESPQRLPPIVGKP